MKRKLMTAHRRWKANVDAGPELRRNLKAVIEEAIDAGMSQSEVARLFDWPRQDVQRVVAGKRWAD